MMPWKNSKLVTDAEKMLKYWFQSSFAIFELASVAFKVHRHL